MNPVKWTDPGLPQTKPKPQSCQLCQQRKVKCDRVQPTCAYCDRHQAECRYFPTTHSRRKKRRLSEGELLKRLERYEALLAAHGIQINEETLPAESLSRFDSNTAAQEASHDSGYSGKATPSTPALGSGTKDTGRFIIDAGKVTFVEE